MQRFLVFAVAASLGLATSVSAAALPNSSTMMRVSPTVVKSCLRAYTLHAAFDTAQLHSLGKTDATPANVNDVPLAIDGSFKYADHIGCFYKSAHNDIFNLVYDFPCVNPVLLSPYTYRCKK